MFIFPCFIFLYNGSCTVSPFNCKYIAGTNSVNKVEFDTSKNNLPLVRQLSDGKCASSDFEETIHIVKGRMKISHVMRIIYTMELCIDLGSGKNNSLRTVNLTSVPPWPINNCIHLSNSLKWMYQ